MTQGPLDRHFLDGLFTEAPFEEAPFTEARRQLTICNACRYCEGYCAVFPALERLGEIAQGDVTHLADLCHDCRDCYTACMYAPPHEFAVNVPAALSAVRRHTYDEYLPRLPWAAGPARRRAMLIAGLGAILLLAVLGVLAGGTRAGMPGAGAGSPYRVITYPALLIAVGLPALGSVLVMTGSAARYWRATGGRGLASPAALLSALRQAASLRNLRGGGADCSYPTDEPSGARRRLHGLVAWGFACCACSTVAAAISQDFAGDPPPYPVLSAPVLLGVIGGSGMVLGCAGLLLLRRAAARAGGGVGADAASGPPREDAALARRGYALLAGLLLLAATGLLTLIGRDTPAFGFILAVHLAAVVVCFAIAPYTKFMHVIYRFLALVHEAKAGLGWSGGENNGGSCRAAARRHGGGVAARPGGPRHVHLGPAGDRDRRGLPAAWRAPLNRVTARRHAGGRGLPDTGRGAGPVPAGREAVPARRDRGRGRPAARGGAATVA